MLRKRPHLAWLAAPYVLYLAALPAVNRLHPTVAGLPFLFFWLLLATLLTPAAVYLAWRGDRAHRARRTRDGAGGTDRGAA
ncbi:hypothetical protein GCM10010218_17950 [Streptomyces mashuensis]|uniref:DUF3311 domain-containing protein n=1 Tax=Streptomyces mashuensis TaxID=33904 RepID=A0A919B0H3_9ACTN|nr:DUF3311 domain-containing protein [Streptomyces mashuensis]GHF36803.1 hypothetical protein GCM10010218_17950 [Streptomyces mashuensis]